MAKEVNVKVVSHKDEVLAEFKHMKAVALEAVGTQAESNVVLQVQAMGAIDTGILVGSIDHGTDEDSAIIGTNTEYAFYVHAGTGIYAKEGGRQTPWVYKDAKGNWHRTVGMKPRPFLEKGIMNYIDEYREIVENYMTKN